MCPRNARVSSPGPFWRGFAARSGGFAAHNPSSVAGSGRVAPPEAPARSRSTWENMETGVDAQRCRPCFILLDQDPAVTRWTR